jgi:hypothetical protein
MKKYNKVLTMFFLLTFILQLLGAKEVRAIGEEKNIILLIDNSGSMKKNSSDKFSVSAASMLIDSIDENTNLNIISFGNEPKVVQELLDKPSREALKVQLSNMKFDESNTNLKEGLKAALNQLQKVSGEKSIIVLSDGKEDPKGGLTNTHMDELYSLVEAAHSSNIKIHCIGLTEEADSDTLGKITFKTGGEYYYCSNPSELFKVFSSILGSISDFYTIKEFTTDIKNDEEIKLSSYIEEVIIKVASCDNKAPLVNITENEKELIAEKIGDTYKIYKLNNNEDKTIKISSRDEGENFVSVQIKSKEKINIDSMEHNFSIPCGVPMDIDLFLDNKNIKGLHMDKLQGRDHENVNSYEEGFRFTFKKEKSGQYPILITAYDGQGNIIAVKNFNINVTDYPPFNYINKIPKELIEGESLKVELRLLKTIKVDNPSGEVIIDYGKSYDKFPLKFENNNLVAEVKPEKTGDFKITAYINGTYNNEEFSYYLPYYKVRIKDKPSLELEAVDTNMTAKQNENIELMLRVKENKTYDDEVIKVLDINNKEMASINFTKDTKGIIKVPIILSERGNNLIFKLKGGKNLKLTESLHTNIKVISVLEYYGKPFILPSILMVVMTFLTIAALWFLKRSYKQYSEYSISKEITYRLKSNPIYNSLNMTLSVENNTQYLDLKGNSVTIEHDQGNNSIGYFALNLPKGSDLSIGLKYLMNKEKIFTIEYSSIKDQMIRRDEEDTYETTVEYDKNIELSIKSNKEYVIINFL